MPCLERLSLVSLAIFLLGLIGSILIVLGIPPWLGTAVNLTLVLLGLVLIVVAVAIIIVLTVYEIL